MKAISGKEFVKLLEKNGWQLCRIKGSYHVYRKDGRTEHITVPIHGNASLKIGLQKYLMKIAKLDNAE